MMAALGVEPIDMSDMIRKLRTRLQADIQELVDEAVAPLSERIAALKEEQMSLMLLEFYETVDKTVAALRERIATLEKQLSTLVSLPQG
jgi:polyhydroxyalkanoate synthesis regulator phasin